MTARTYYAQLKTRAESHVPQTMPLTGLVVTIVVICLGIYDLIMVVWKGTGSSVSDFLIRAGYRATAVHFAFAFVMGHLFGKMTPVGTTPTDNIWGYISAGIFGLGVGYAICFWFKVPREKGE